MVVERRLGDAGLPWRSRVSWPLERAVGEQVERRGEDPLAGARRPRVGCGVACPGRVAMRFRLFDRPREPSLDPIRWVDQEIMGASRQDDGSMDRSTPTSPSSDADRSAACWPPCSAGSGHRVRGARAPRPSPTRCPGPCTSTTRSPASSRRAGSAASCRRSPNRQTSTSGATAPAQVLLRFGRPRRRSIRLARLQHVLAARPRAR